MSGLSEIMSNCLMKIIEYSDQYRDDMIFMVLEAKNALGRIPHLNEDLLDIQRHYLDKAEPFYLALSDESRVIGCMGYHAIPGTDHVRLQRLYVKCNLKQHGIGSTLLKTVEQHAIQCGKTKAIAHLGNQDYWESRLFCPAQGYCFLKENNMCKSDNSIRIIQALWLLGALRVKGPITDDCQSIFFVLKCRCERLMPQSRR